MAAAHDRFCRNCVDENEFLTQLDDLKQDSKTRKSRINVFVTDEFYSKAQNFQAKGNEETTNDISQNDMTKHELQIINRKKRKLNADNQIVTSEGKLVLCRSQLYQNLPIAYQRVAHRGRQKTEKWIQDSFSEVTQKVVNLFVQLCNYHAELKPITNRVKEVTKPLQKPAFPSLIELNLMDFHKTPCKCGKQHQWVLKIIDDYTKYVTCSSLKNQTAIEVLEALQNYCYTFGFPKKILSDNGSEFSNQILNTFCQEHY